MSYMALCCIACTCSNIIHVQNDTLLIYCLNPHFSYSTDTDGMLSQALLVGNFEAAVDICISSDRMVSTTYIVHAL